MSAAPEIFDRRLHRQRRDRAAGDLDAHGFLFQEVAERLAERLEDFTYRFPVALDLGCHTGYLAPMLAGRGGIETLVQSDLSADMIGQAARASGRCLVADEEALPFAAESFDLVISGLSLHWVNDLPGTLLQVRQCLRPDGLFLAALLGGETLKELRAVLLQAESEVTGGASPRVSPFAELRDLGGLLQRAGFALPVADSDTITVRYSDFFKLLADLRGMGETSVLRERPRGALRRDLLARAAELYQEQFVDKDGRLTATFQIHYLTAWAPHESQQQPLKPGSAQARLAEALDSTEQPAGEKTGPEDPEIPK